MQRREFIKGTMAVSGVCAATCTGMGRTVVGDDDPFKADGTDHFVELAIATICTDGFANRHHEPAFRVIPELGFRNVEFNLWYADTISDRYMESIRARCAATGLVPISLQGSGFGAVGNGGVAKDVAHKSLFLKHARSLGCSVVKFTGARRGQEGGLDAVIEVCKEIAPLAEELDIVVALENHARNNLEQIEDYARVFEEIDSKCIAMCLDTGHFEGVGVDLLEVVERFGPRIRHVDLKDCAARGQGHKTVPFGSGVTDFDSFLSALMECHYSGYLVVEQAWSEPQGDWQRDLKAAYARFAQWQTST